MTTQAHAEPVPAAPPPEPKIGARRIVTTGIWQALGHGGGVLIRFGLSLVLTRMLAQDAYGVMAIVTSVLVGLSLFSDIGTYQSILQNPRGRDADFRATAWTIAIARGVCLGLVAMAIAPLVAAAYPDYPGLAGLIRWAAIVPMLEGAASTAIYVAWRDLRVRETTLIELAAAVLSGAITIGVAWWDPTPWAFVAGQIASAVFRTAISHAVLGWRDRFGWDPAVAREIVHFGRWIFVSTVLTFFAQNADRLLLGLFLLPAQLGVYSVAVGIATIVPAIVTRFANGVVMPALSNAVNRGDPVPPAFQRIRRPLFVLSGWALAGLIGGGDPIAALLYRAEWADIGWILRWAGITLWVSSALDGPRIQALFAMKHTRPLAASMSAKLVVVLAAVPLGFHFGGFTGVLAGYFVAELAKFAVTAWCSMRAGLREFGTDCRHVLAFAAGCAVSWAVAAAIAAAGAAPWLQCATVFVATSLYWLPAGWRELRPAVEAMRRG